jgi:hypothetical protein
VFVPYEAPSSNSCKKRSAFGEMPQVQGFEQVAVFSDACDRKAARHTFELIPTTLCNAHANDDPLRHAFRARVLRRNPF